MKLKHKLLVAGIALLIAAAFAATYPVALLVLAAAALGWWKGRHAGVLAVLALAACAGIALASAASIPGALRGEPAQLHPAAWLSGSNLAGPADRAGRLGVAGGALLGALLAAALGRGAGSGRHDEKHVHGLRIAENAAKGTRRWAGDRDLAHVAEFGPPREGKFGGGTLVGRLNGRIVRLMPEKCTPPLPQHACVVAGTGAGKSFSFVVPNAIAAACEGESLVMTDPKGELACLLAPWLREQGYKVYLFNLAYPQWSSCWNPVLECRDDEEIAAFAAAIVQNAAKDTSGYFVMKEIQLLKALIYLLRADFPAEQAHLRSALSLLSWPLEALDKRFERAFREGRLNQTGFEEWRGAVSSNFDNACSGLTAKLGVVRAEPVARLLSRQEMDLSALGREKAALFCVLPIGSAHLKPVLASFYYFFFRRLYGLAAERGGRLPVPTRFILDEFANVGQIPGFVEIISTARSLGIKIQFVLQGLKQLQDCYGGPESEAILSNCPVQLFLGGDDATTTRYFSHRLGEAAVYATTERRDVTLPWDRLEVPKRTEGVARRALMEPEELSGMDPLAAVALVRWALPVYLRKVGWTELPQAREIREMAAGSLAEVAPARADGPLPLPQPPEPEGDKEPPARPDRRRGRKPEWGGNGADGPGGDVTELLG